MKWKVKKTTVGPVALVGMLLALLVLANPAAATTVGSGGGTGDYDFTATGTLGSPPFCARFDSMSYTSDPGFTADITVNSGTNTASYSGDVEVTFSATEVFWGNPFDDYTNADGGEDCEAHEADAVSIAGSLVSDGSTALSCTGLTGTWDRTTGFAVVTTLSGNCTVGSVSSAATIRMTTALVACNGGPPTDCDSQDVLAAS